MRLIPSILIAFSTYSRLPMPEVEWTEENRKYSMCFFPLVGAVVGGALGLWLFLCRSLGLGPFLQGAVGAALPLLVTGGIHMDGFMDTSDALASWQPREKKLEILKDSRIGAFAAMGCAAYLLVTAGLMSELALEDAPSLAMVFLASRALSAWAATSFRSARPQGMLDGFARAAQARAVRLSGGLYLAVCLGVWAFTSGWTALLCAGTAALVTLYYRHMAYKQFGGVTGDLAGWYSQVLEFCLLLAVVVGGMLK